MQKVNPKYIYSGNRIGENVVSKKQKNKKTKIEDKGSEKQVDRLIVYELVVYHLNRDNKIFYNSLHNIQPPHISCLRHIHLLLFEGSNSFHKAKSIKNLIHKVKVAYSV